MYDSFLREATQKERFLYSWEKSKGLWGPFRLVPMFGVSSLLFSSIFLEKSLDCAEKSLDWTMVSSLIFMSKIALLTTFRFRPISTRTHPEELDNHLPLSLVLNTLFKLKSSSWLSRISWKPSCFFIMSHYQFTYPGA